MVIWVRPSLRWMSRTTAGRSHSPNAAATSSAYQNDDGILSLARSQTAQRVPALRRRKVAPQRWQVRSCSTATEVALRSSTVLAIRGCIPAARMAIRIRVGRSNISADACARGTGAALSRTSVSFESARQGALAWPLARSGAPWNPWPGVRSRTCARPGRTEGEGGTGDRGSTRRPARWPGRWLGARHVDAQAF